MVSRRPFDGSIDNGLRDIAGSGKQFTRQFSAVRFVAMAAILQTSSEVRLRFLSSLLAGFRCSRREVSTRVRRVPISVSSSYKSEALETSNVERNSNRWKPICLYHAQGKCTLVSGKFSHLSCNMDKRAFFKNVLRKFSIA